MMDAVVARSRYEVRLVGCLNGILVFLSKSFFFCRNDASFCLRHGYILYVFSCLNANTNTCVICVYDN